MPMVSGMLALQQNLSYYPAYERPARRSRSSVPAITVEDIQFTRAQKHLSDNVKSNVGIYQEVIPSHSGRLTGVLVMEAKKGVEHQGIFLLLKGLPLSRRRRLELAGEGKKGVSSIKFVVLGSTGGSPQGTHFLEPGCESYPLELEIPQSHRDLPPPLITADGKLTFVIQAYISMGGKHLLLTETHMQYQGYRSLEESEDIEKPIRLHQRLQYKRFYLGKKKSVDVILSCENSGYLAGEVIEFLLVAKNVDKMAIHCRVSLEQKLWYQAASDRQAPGGRRLSVKMGTNVVCQMDKVENDKSKEEMIWKGGLRIPRYQAPTFKHDFLNSINYTLKSEVSVWGHEETKVVTEVPVYLATTRDADDYDVFDGDDYADDDSRSGASGTDTPFGHTGSMILPDLSRSWNSLSGSRGSATMPRAGSLTSVRFGGSVPFRSPPSYSQLARRRPTLDALPPPYSEVELEDKWRKSQEQNGF